MTTAKISNYSATPASNNAASPDGWPEGMAPSGLNNSDREFASRVREFYEDSGWIDYGETINTSTSTTVSLAGDTTAYTVIGRAVRVNQDDAKVGYVTAAAYSAPNTSITASGLNLTGATIVEFGGVRKYEANPHLAKVRAVSAANQTIATGTVTLAQFGTETFDTMGIYASHVMTATTATAGYYAVDWAIVYDAPSAAGTATSFLYKNASLYANGTDGGTFGTGYRGGISAGSDLVSLAAGDTLSVYAYQVSGGNLETIAGSCKFSARKVP
jgi:hypothetical protein